MIHITTALKNIASVLTSVVIVNTSGLFRVSSLHLASTFVAAYYVQSSTQFHFPPEITEIFRDPQEWDPFMVIFPYYSHTTPIRIPKYMGIVWYLP